MTDNQGQINTTKGMMDVALLEKRTGTIDSETDLNEWTEYWHEGELVRRDVHITLKLPVTAFGEVESLGG